MKSRVIRSILCLPILCVSAAAPAQEELFRLLTVPPEARTATRLVYGVEYFGDEAVDDQDTGLETIEHDFRFSTSVADADTLSLFTSVHAQDIGTRAVLPESMEPFPGGLWDIRFGAADLHRFENGWLGAASVELGSASDRPFDSADEITVAANGVLRVPDQGRNAWLFLVNFSNHRSFLNYVPIPGVAYQYQPSDDLTAILGIPMAFVTYRPGEDSQLKLSVLPVRRVHAEFCYDFAPDAAVFTEFSWDNDGYFRADRPDEDDQLYYYEMHTGIGIRADICRGVSVELSGGYVIDRFYFEGEDYDDRGDDRIDLDPGTFVGLNLEAHL